MNDGDLTAEQVRWFRLRRSGLVDPFSEATAAAAALFGVQAQILPAAGLSLWNRLADLSHARFDALLHEERSLVKLWGQRGTLHLYPSAEWPLLSSALQHRPSWWERHASENPQYGSLVADIEAMLVERGSIGRSDLRASDLPLDEYYLSSWGGVFYELVRRGIACHGPQAGGEGRFFHREQWLPELAWEAPPPVEANIEIARRYFAAYGPAAPRDFTYWRGANLSDARPWIEALRPELVEVQVDGQAMLARRDDLPALHEAPPEREGWPVRLLYRFDPLLLALKDKSWIVADEHYGYVWRPAGHIEGTILEHGRLRGTWRYDRVAGGLLITLRPFAPLPEHARAAIESHAQGVAAFFDLPLVGIEEEAPRP